MNVTFLSDNPMNSAVVDLAGGGHLYNITTEHTESSGSPDVRSTTTVSDPAGAVVAVWERTHTRERDRITFRDKMHVLGDWLPKKSPLSKCVSSPVLCILVLTRLTFDFLQDEDTRCEWRGEVPLEAGNGMGV